ncbi:hypothetical protein [Anaerolentibacter hominis]|uniref:hypothetical protein n=1 Tax=Anaerolentibacter hominis TaxID=3079009 RepID=UPI0031B82CD0
MSDIKIIPCPEFYLNEEPEGRIIELADEDYIQRVDLLQARMEEKGLDYVCIYGDREHFSNIEYFTKYDCRFEEGLFIMSRTGQKYILVGNEGMAYSFLIPYDIERILYQNFSLQGQPRDKIVTLTEIFEDVGMTPDSKVGLVGYKYFYPAYYAHPERHHDVPAYLLAELMQVTSNVINFTEEITGLPDGLRMTIRSPREIAVIEQKAVKAANIVLRILKSLKPGMSELEASVCGKLDYTPINVHPMLNFGDSIPVGLKSPSDRVFLTDGDLCNVCYSFRGSLISRTGVAASSFEKYPEELKPELEAFYMEHWRAIAKWYETIKAGVTGGELYKNVTDIIGGEKFGMTLNPGHNIGTDEWSNSPVYENSEIPVHSGTHMQCDIIASSSDPVMCAICEDTVVIADQQLRDALKNEYPEVYARIIKRQEMMRSSLNIPVSDDVLLMSNLNGVYFPFMLDLNSIMAQN